MGLHYSHVTQADRISIQALMQAKHDGPEIARQPTLSRSTINRYIRRGKAWPTALACDYQSGKKHISERPEAAHAREEIGHFEGDTVIGSDKRHCPLTLIDRKTGFTAIEKMAARTKDEPNTAMCRAIARMRCPVKTITLDNGTEFHGYEVIEQSHAVQIYFATPHHSWERGTDENSNGVIRQYLPKDTSMKKSPSSTAPGSM